MLKVAEYSGRIADLKERVRDTYQKADIELNFKESSSDKIRLVFAGQYSAGKSTIISMLTGRDDIEIGAAITTQDARVFNWNGIEITDTPGIHTELRHDHDEITYDAIAAADLLVFVITNELFDSYMADHFRKLAIEKDKAGEMILVVNKMERTALGNTEEQQDVIREDLRKVLEPYTPEQLNLSFLDAQSYLDSLKEKEDDPEYASELYERSGYDKFIDTLNHFVDEKGINAKLTTDLYELDDCLEKTIASLQPKSEDDDINALEENFIQQRNVLIESRGRMRQEIKDIYTTAAAKIRNIGLDSANLITLGCKQEEVESELQKSIQETDNIVEKCEEDAIETVKLRMGEIGAALELIENSEFSMNLKARLFEKFDKLPDDIKNIIGGAGPGLQKAGEFIAKRAYAPGAQGLKLTAFSGGQLRNVVVKVGHVLGHKFKPWEALKVTRGIAVGAGVLSVLGVGLSVFMQIKSDYDEKKAEEELRKNRLNIRSQFNAAASSLEDHSTLFIEDNIDKNLNGSIAQLDASIQEIRNTRENKSELCRKLEELQRECRGIIQEIHSDMSEVV